MNETAQIQGDPTIALSRLPSLVAEQQRELQRLGIDPDLITRPDCLFDKFQSGDRFQRIIDLAIDYSKPESLRSSKMRRRFTYRLYRDMTWYYISALAQQDSTIILSPERTLEFFSLLYPGVAIIGHPFELDSLGSIPTPNGIRVNPRDLEHIAEVCEYVYSPYPNVLLKKLISFKSKKMDFPQLFTNANVLFVIPSGNSPQFVSRETKIIYTSMPFTGQRFEDYVDRLYQHYRF